MLNSGEEGMMVFEPAFIRVKKGESVTFLPTDPGHDSVSVYTPEGASGWAGKNSKEVTVTFDTEGVYLYKCTPHAMMGMVGVIQVGETHNKKAVKKAVKKLSKTVAMNKDRLKKYMADVK
ncbi:MAG: pseudoazurin [Gammaproteobacteria bacterium]|nr:MAG: pseudoazurin [Gammaproteobacteria bacterium]